MTVNSSLGFQKLDFFFCPLITRTTDICCRLYFRKIRDIASVSVQRCHFPPWIVCRRLFVVHGVPVSVCDVCVGKGIPMCRCGTERRLQLFLSWESSVSQRTRRVVYTRQGLVTMVLCDDSCVFYSQMVAHQC